MKLIVPAIGLLFAVIVYVNADDLQVDWVVGPSVEWNNSGEETTVDEENETETVPPGEDDEVAPRLL